jgi:hypothetical protein
MLWKDPKFPGCPVDWLDFGVGATKFDRKSSLLHQISGERPKRQSADPPGETHNAQFILKRI